MMRAMVRLGIDNPVLLNLVFVLVCAAGLYAYVVMPKEEFPQVATDRVIVSVPYPGASPEEIEDTVVRPIEDALDRVEGLEHVYVDVSEGQVLFTLEFQRGTDVDEARNETQRAVDGTDGLPEAALSPRVNIARLTIPLARVALTGDARRLDVAESLADDLLAIKGVGEVYVRGASERRIRVELAPRQAAASGASPQRVAEALGRAAAGLPAGFVDVTDQDVLVRTAKGVWAVPDLVDVPLSLGATGDRRVGDLAQVFATWHEPSRTYRADGQPSIELLPIREDDADALVVVPRIQAWAAERATDLPPGLGLLVYDDTARMVRDRLEVLASNGLMGALLVCGVLVMFIGWRNALLVAWGMPVAYLGAVAAMYASGTTINVVSTFGLLIVTGIIVDDAVVIVENVHRHLEQGKDRLTAAVDGTIEVAPAVFAATLTTCLAFAPLHMLEGTVGRVMRIVPTAVILSLLASLFEAFFVLPGHLAHYAQELAQPEENLPTRLLKRAYTPILERVTRRGNRLPLLAGATVFFLVCMSLTLGMKTSLTTAGKPVFAFIDVELQPASDVSVTRAVVRDLERFVRDEAPDLVLYASGRVGEQESPMGLPTWGARFGQLKVGFHNQPEVLERVPAFLDAIRAHARSLDGVQEVGIATLTGGPPAGRPVDVRVRGRDAEAVLGAAKELVAFLGTRPGVRDVRPELGAGSEAFEVRVDARKTARLGLTAAEVAGAVRAAMDGATALDLSVEQRTTEVRVGFPEPTTLSQVADLPLTLRDGRMVRVRSVADVVRTRGLEKLSRVDGERAVRISADVDAFTTSSAEEKAALDEAFPAIAARWPGVSLFYGGELADTAESFAELPAAMLLAIGLIYFVLAVQFESYLQPLLILAAVPMGLAGVVLGLFLLQMDVSFIAAIGAVGLVGIVVNDALVLIDFINRERSLGMSARDAVVEASLVRLRPILITTVTTVLGLLPLALGLAGEDPLLAPMAVAISFGLSFATALTLVVVPVLYLVLDDVEVWIARRLPGGSPVQG